MLIFQYHLYKAIVWLMPLYNVPACNLAFFGVSHVERLNSCYNKRKYGYHILVNLLVFQCILREQNTDRSEEHTSELQSRGHLVCRLLLEKKKSHEYIACGRRISSTDE